MTAQHLASGSTEELADAMLAELVTLAGASHAQILLAGDLAILASRPSGACPALPLGIALDAIADGRIHWDEAGSQVACCLPMPLQDGIFAVLLMAWEGTPPAGAERVSRIEDLLPFAALALSHRRLQAALAQRDVQLMDLGARYDDAMQRAVTDGLTGLINHAHFKELLGFEIGRSKRYGNHMTLLLLDIDLFKNINDTYGHLIGDVVIRRVAQALKGRVRDCDQVARYGGEEFAILLPQTDLPGAYIVADRIRLHIRDMVFHNDEQQPIPPVTLSIGVAQLRQSDSLLSLIERADHALYAAKRGGRDTVCCEDGETPVLSVS
ncbi:MAG TPA: GGDEF domain-containing protein [Pantanalinema sp.]